MDIPLDLLRTFTTFVESRNIEEASTRLGLSQPAVSVQLKKLEGYLPHPLLSFQGKKKVLSHYGRAVYEAIQQDLERIQKNLRDVNMNYLEGREILLKIGARKEIFPWLVDKLRFDTKIHLVDLSTEASIDLLLKKEIDVAINHVRPDVPTIVSKPFFNLHTRLVVHKKLLAGRKASIEAFMDPDFLRQVPAIAYRPSPPFLSRWAQTVGLTAQDLNIRIFCEDWTVVTKLVDMGLGWTLLPHYFEPSHKDVLSFDVPSDRVPDLKFYVLYHQDMRKVKAVKELIEFDGSV